MFTYKGNLVWKKSKKHAAGKLPFEVKAKNTAEATKQLRKIKQDKAKGTGAWFEFNDKIEAKAK